MEHTNYMNRSNTLKTTVCCHTCVLVTFITSYIYKSLTGLPKSNREIQSILLTVRRKIEILTSKFFYQLLHFLFVLDIQNVKSYIKILHNHSYMYRSPMTIIRELFTEPG